MTKEKITYLHVIDDNNEQEYEVEFYYIPGETTVLRDSNGTGHPGCPPEVEIISVCYEGEDITNTLTIKRIKADIEETCLGCHGKLS